MLQEESHTKDLLSIQIDKYENTNVQALNFSQRAQGIIQALYTFYSNETFKD